MSGNSTFVQHYLRGRGRPSPERNLVALRIDIPSDQRYLVVYHEYVHILMRLNLGDLPLWLDEGLAEFFGHAVLSEGESTLGTASPGSLQILRTQPMLPISLLRSVTHDSPYYRDKDKAEIFYAQSWALTHYLMIGDNLAHAKRLDDYIMLIRKGVSEQEAAAQALGDMNVLQQSLQNYVYSQALGQLHIPAQLAVKEDEYEASRLSPAESLASRGEVLVYMNKLDRARVALESSLQMDPRCAKANEVMGLLFLRLGNREQAGKYFSAAAQLNSKSFLAQYYAAQSEYQQDRDVEAAETYLRKALEINPRFAPAYEMLAYILSLRETTRSEALDMAIKAATLEPAELRHSFRVCEILMSMDRNNEAYLLAEGVLARAVTDEDRGKAESLISQIKSRLNRILKPRQREEVAAEQPQRQGKEAEARRKDAKEPEKQRQSQPPPSGQPKRPEVGENDRGHLKTTVLYETTLNTYFGVLLRREPNEGSEFSFRIEPGTTIEILERGETFYKARVGGITGYIPKSFLKQK